jgi:molecular chaperone GrpE
MTEKKHSKQTEDQVQAKQAAEASETQQAESVAQPSPSEDFETLRIQLSEAEAKSAENLDGWQRALAEFQNYKKRVERDRASEQAAMKGDLVKKILPVLDDLERALQNRPDDNAWSNGIELIQRKLQAILEAEGVKRIEAEGAVFDPNFHEAISQEPVDGAESGRVVTVTQQGYTLGDRVIRPAQVRVAA